MKPAPPWLNDEAALLLIDWSSWLHKAFAISGLDMVGTVVGWLTRVLADRPAHLAIALDGPGPTHRHRAQHPRDEAWKYKGNRLPKPDDFRVLSEICTELAELHAIPALWSPEREADDVIATTTARARELGYRVWICSPDKDLCSLVEAGRPGGQPYVGMWDNFAEGETWRGPEQVIAKFGVGPEQVADWLAICGDGVDAVPGVPSLGGTKAAAILRVYQTLEAALYTPAWTEQTFGEWEGQGKALLKRRKITTDEETLAKIDETRTTIKERLVCERARAVLHEHADVARFSRTLTALDCGVPLRIDWRALPVGGFDVDGLRARYEQLGMTAKARQVPAWRKRPPWAIPFEDG